MHETLTPEAYGLTDDLAAQINALAEAAAAKAAAEKEAAKASKPKRARAKMTDAAWEAAKAGNLPPAVEIPASNYWTQKRFDALRDLAAAGDLRSLQKTEIAGTNTYAKALRDYRLACIAYVEFTTASMGAAA